MMRRLLIAALVILAVLPLAAVGAVRFIFPPASPAAPPPTAISAAEHARTIASMAPPKRARPVIAVVGQNDGTETTDYLVPFGVLARSEVAEVHAVATRPEPLKLMPALTVEPQLTIEQFDARFPGGADYVIVPALHHVDDPAVVNWIRKQAAEDATVVGVCSGVKTLAAAGLLTDRKATGHWYDIEDLRQANPSMQWVRDRRYVADRGVVTTTGVTASVPVSLALVEAIGGRARARELADALGASSWDARHHTEDFALDRQHVWTAIGNKLAFWKHEIIGIPVEDGVDEIALALAADAYARTYRSSAATIGEGTAPLSTAGDLRLLPDSNTPTADREVELVTLEEERPVQALDHALDDIAERYGGGTAKFVALQLEYTRTE